jgi:hypothetical protein
MLHWIADKIMDIVTFVPAIFVDQQSPSFGLVRAMFGLLLITSIAYAIAMVPFRTIIRQLSRRISMRSERPK